MPQVFTTNQGNMFAYAADEELHPILNAIVIGNLDHFALAIANLATVTIGAEVMPLAYPGDLYLDGQDAYLEHGVSRNLAWLAAHYQHYHLLNFMFVNREVLGLGLSCFIAVANMANRGNSPLQLRQFVEANPQIIEVYNQEMGPQHQYLPAAQM